MSFLKKILTFALAIFICFGTTFTASCFNDVSAYNPIKINIVVEEGSKDVRYFYDAISRFQEASKEVSYSLEHTGVEVELVIDCQLVITDQRLNGFDIYLADKSRTNRVWEWVKDNHVIDLNDVLMDENYFEESGVLLQDKIDLMSQNSIKAGFGDYYAVPFTTELVGLTYDVNEFERGGYFLAKNSVNAKPFESEILNEVYYFVNSSNDSTNATNKSAGPDGVYDTYDDGLPSNLFELVVLCEKIKNDDKYPFISAGKDSYRSDYLVQALTTSLLGYEQAKACMELNGQLEVVTGFTSQPLFKGLRGDKMLYKPTTALVKMTENCGYYASWALARYYAQAFMELSLEMDWWADSSYISERDFDSVTREFIYNGYDQSLQRSLMLVESSDWYNKIDDKVLERFNKLYNWDGGNERKLRWMSLPTLFDGKENNSELLKEQTFQKVHSSYLVIAENVWSNAYKVQACKDFIRFLSTDQECYNYTLYSGMRRALSYDTDGIDLYIYGDYYGSLSDVMVNAKLVCPSSMNLTTNKSPEYFEGGKKDKRLFYLKIDDAEEEYIKTYTSVFEYYQEFYNANSISAFKSTLYDKNNWHKIYGGNEQITEYEINGTPVRFI